MAELSKREFLQQFLLNRANRVESSFNGATVAGIALEAWDIIESESKPKDEQDGKTKVNGFQSGDAE